MTSSTADSIEIVFNGQPCRVATGTTVAALVAQAGLTPRHVAVELNLEVVPRAQHPDRTLAAGDQVEIVTLVGGG
jgi:sulfur carrier protein